MFGYIDELDGQIKHTSLIKLNYSMNVAYISL